MKRDWDIIRAVLAEVEGFPDDQRNTFGYGAPNSNFEKDPAKVEHALLLYQSGFLKAIDCSSNGGPGIISPTLTWSGHDLLDTIRSKQVWERIKSLARERGLELTFDVVKALGSVALQQIMRG